MILASPTVIIILYSVIAFFLLVILSVIFVVIIRRLYKQRYYEALDVAREEYAPLVDSLIKSSIQVDDPLFKNKVNSVKWLALEEHLLRALDESGEAVRLRVEECLESLGIVDLYMSDLKSGKKFRAPLCAERLGRIRSKRAVPELINALSANNRDLRNMAVNSLGIIGDESAIPPLVVLFREAAEKTEDISIRIMKNAFLSFGGSVVPFLIEEVGSLSWRVRSKALDVLCESSDPVLKAIFLEAVKDAEPEVRAKGAKGLGNFKEEDGVIEPLIGLTDDEYWIVRYQSVKSLGSIGAQKAVEAFKSRIGDANWQVRRAAAEGLGKLGLTAVKVFADVLLRSTDRFAREQVAEELQRSGLIYVFIENLRKPSGSKASEQLLIDVGKNGVISPLLDAMNDPDPVMRCKVAALLGRIGNFRAREVLESVGKKDGDLKVKLEASRALAYIPNVDPAAA